MKNFWYIISFVCGKQWPLVTCMQGKLAETYFGFRKTEEIMKWSSNTSKGQ